MGMLEELRIAESVANNAPPCKICSLIDSEEDIETREALTRAAAGTIGMRKLRSILQGHGIVIGRVAIERHRTERHGS